MLDIALVHHLVSKYTSLVAVDVTVTKPAHLAAVRTALPHNMPEGLDFDAIAVGLPRTATPAPLLIVAGFCTLLLALAIAVLRAPGLHFGRGCAI